MIREGLELDPVTGESPDGARHQTAAGVVCELGKEQQIPTPVAGRLEAGLKLLVGRLDVSATDILRGHLAALAADVRASTAVRLVDDLRLVAKSDDPDRDTFLPCALEHHPVRPAEQIEADFARFASPARAASEMPATPPS